jgi:hypothetical protein
MRLSRLEWRQSAPGLESAPAGRYRALSPYRFGDESGDHDL